MSSKDDDDREHRSPHFDSNDVQPDVPRSSPPRENAEDLIDREAMSPQFDRLDVHPETSGMRNGVTR